jgi:hypothetical protein
MTRRSRARKPRAQKAHEVDYTWEVDGEVLRASDGWVEWGGELILSMGETSGGAPYGLSLREYQAIQVRETERKQRMEERRKRTWEHLTVDLGGLMGALASHDPNLVWVLDLESGEAVYLRDLKNHSIFLHPDGVVGFGVVGLTQPIRDLTGGPGCLVEAALMAYGNRLICDGLLVEAVGLGPHFLANYNQTYKELKTTGGFHIVPRRRFTAPPQALNKPAMPPAETKVEGQTEDKTSIKARSRCVPEEPVAHPGQGVEGKYGKVAFTPLQGQYLAFIQAYATLNGCPPAERDMQVFFGVTAPVVHQMILGLAAKGYRPIPESALVELLRMAGQETQHRS